VTKLRASLIRDILIERPELVDFFDLDKLNKSYLSELITAQPGLVDKIDLNRVDGDTLVELFKTHPDWIKKLNFNYMDEDDVVDIFYAHPELLDTVDYSTNYRLAEELISVFPDKVDKILEKINFKYLDNSQFAATVLIFRPNYINKIDPSMIEDEDKENILTHQPQLRSKLEDKNK
jgi:hypothetical protein